LNLLSATQPPDGSPLWSLNEQSMTYEETVSTDTPWGPVSSFSGHAEQPTHNHRHEHVSAVSAKVNGIIVPPTVRKIDEAHMYKNKRRMCNIPELSYTDSAGRAEDLALKLDVLRQRRHDEALARGVSEHAIVERVATFATGTPIANSLGELWVMQQYLRPDLLEVAGVAELGDWAATFTATHTTIEVNATGTKLRPVTRVAKYTNLPELLALANAYTDVVTRDQVPVKLPELRTGARQIISLQPDTELVDFIADLGWRADHLDPRKPQRDNILKISSDGRNASLDPRLAHLGTPRHSRAAEVAAQAMRIHQRHAHRQYRDPDTGQLQPLRGGLQLMFCDRGTPSKDPHQFTIYQAIKDELAARGMPAEAVRFVHEARNPVQLKALFAQCNRGEVSVLIGSTEKMGTGTNVQSRLTALHHVDVPWRPADLEQREGRIMRQGNQNDEIDILNYVTESSYDTVMWQRVQAKALFIEQMRRNEVLDTEIEDLSGGDIGAAAAETKAIATGDPRYLRQVELDDAVRRLTALERSHQQSVRNRDWQVRVLDRAIDGHHPVIVADLREDRPTQAATVGLPIRVGGVVVMDHKPGRR
jgi:Helicase conserved C-terminal domain